MLAGTGTAVEAKTEEGKRLAKHSGNFRQFGVRRCY